MVNVPTINRDTGIESFEFEARMSGYYSDPILDPAEKKAIKANMARTSSQNIFAPATEGLFKAVLGSPKIRAGSRFFIEGEYTFAYGPREDGSCIELTHI